MLELLLSILFSVLPACPTEVSTDCAWDASTRGNSAGTSFVALGDYYWPVNNG